MKHYSKTEYNTDNSIFTKVGVKLGPVQIQESPGKLYFFAHKNALYNIFALASIGFWHQQIKTYPQVSNTPILYHSRPHLPCLPKA